MLDVAAAIEKLNREGFLCLQLPAGFDVYAWEVRFRRLEAGGYERQGHAMSLDAMGPGIDVPPRPVSADALDGEIRALAAEGYAPPSGPWPR